MSASQFPRCFPGFVLLVGLAAIGCGLIDEPAPPEVQPTDASGAVQPLDENRRQRLELTHRRITQLFINQPQFGGQRTAEEQYPGSDVVRAPGSPPTAWDFGGSWFRTERGKDAPPHASFQKRAAELARPPDSAEALPGQVWEFRKVQLVGLVKHPEPVAYVSDQVPMAKGAGEIPTRSLDEFEVRGLKKLREGENLYVEMLPAKQARVLGPIYAGAKCVSCHATPGELLGAFTYTYDIDPFPAKTAAGTAIQPVP